MPSNSVMRRFFTSSQPKNDLRKSALAGLGGGIAIGILGFLALRTGHSLLMAPFGASCVLLFSAPASPFSQPVNLVGGHFAATLIGLLLRLLLPNEWWAVALAVAITIAVTSALRITHPPAGADPIIVFVTDPSFEFLFLPVLAGSLGLVAIATCFHAAMSVPYPTKTN